MEQIKEQMGGGGEFGFSFSTTLGEREGRNDAMSQVEMLNPPRELACVRVLRPSTLFRLIS